MKPISLLPRLAVLPAALLLTLVTTTPAVTHAGEPRRIYDLESQNFIDNPDYHESAAELRAARTNPPTRGEPERIYDLEKRQFIANPSYHEPASPQVVIHRAANYEPRRMYDLQSGQYIANPNYREPVAKHLVSNDRVSNKKVRQAPLATHKPEAAPHTRAVTSGHRPV